MSKAVVFDPVRCLVKEAAACLGLTVRSLEKWFLAGAPKNDDGTISVPTLHAWRLARAEQREPSDEARKWERIYRKHKAQIEGLKKQRLRDQLVPIDAAKQELVRLATAVRTLMLSWPRAMAEELVGRNSPAEVETILRTGVDSVLTVLARDDEEHGDGDQPPAVQRPPRPSPSVARRVSAARKNQRKRVGRKAPRSK
jgi:phage terminase Nu1 subunit (DNA packaging protein)